MSGKRSPSRGEPNGRRVEKGAYDRGGSFGPCKTIPSTSSVSASGVIIVDSQLNNGAAVRRGREGPRGNCGGALRPRWLSTERRAGPKALHPFAARGPPVLRCKACRLWRVTETCRIAVRRVAELVAGTVNMRLQADRDYVDIRLDTNGRSCVAPAAHRSTGQREDS